MNTQHSTPSPSEAESDQLRPSAAPSPSSSPRGSLTWVFIISQLHFFGVITYVCISVYYSVWFCPLNQMAHIRRDVGSFFFLMFIYWFIFGCAGSLLLLRLFPSCRARASHGGDLSFLRARVLGHAGSVVVAFRLNCSSACGLFPDWESNPCLLHWQMNSLPLSH